MAGCISGDVDSAGGSDGAGDGSAPTVGSESLDEVAGGGSADGSDGTGRSSDGGAAVPDSPVIDAEFVPGPCRFQPPEGYSPRCGIVAVPMDWDRAEGEVELAVAVFASTTEAPADDPVIYLDGGPGSHALDTIEFSVEEFLEPLLARGDVVFFDQRGAGRSTPHLDCPETASVNRRVEDDPALDDDEATVAFRAALGRCRQRLVDAGIDLTDYNSISNAHDVEAIRIALGYRRWNLFGISYGTKLGLEVLRRHPGAIRAAVLDSVYPPQVDSVLENPSTFVASYEAVIAACADEPACGADGDLADRVRALVARYEADPVEVEVRDWIADERDDVFVTGETIVEIIVGSLYTPSQFTDLPELVAELERGETAAVSTFLSQDRTTERFFSNGMFFAIACNEEVSFADRSEVAAALPADPFGLGDDFDFASNTGNLAFGTCEAFDSGTAPELSNQPVTSDVPTLLLAGVYDPVTPVEWAERAATTLGRSQLVVGPYASHGVSGGACGISIVVAFLDRPADRPDDRCLSEEPLRFVAPPTSAPELEAVTFQIPDFGVEITTVRPVDWPIGALQGDQYRQASFLDPTEFYQVAGDRSLGPVLAEFIAAEQDVELGSARPLGNGTGGPISADTVPGTWQRRSGRNGAVAVEWYETELDGQATYVVLVSPVGQVEENLASVVLPALTAIEVRGL